MTYLKIHVFHSIIRLPQGNIATKKISHFLTLSVTARKYAHKSVGQLAAQIFYKGPLMIDSVLRTLPN